MKYHQLILGVFVLCLSARLSAQTESKGSDKKSHFTFYAGVGPNIYFNNLVVGKDYVKENNFSFAGRLMWEPEHLLSLGIESGYYCLYKMDFKEQSDATISNYAVPIQIVVCMKFLKTFYFNFASGQSFLIGKVNTPKYGTINTSVLSLGDFAGSFGYRKIMNNRFSLGAETKFFYSAKLNDKNIAFIFMGGFSF